MGLRLTRPPKARKHSALRRYVRRIADYFHGSFEPHSGLPPPIRIPAQFIEEQAFSESLFRRNSGHETNRGRNETVFPRPRRIPETVTG
jgi:hypothetical protein